jgi:uncharacterized protein
MIERYGDGGFVIDGTRHAGAILITPDGVLPWDLTDPAQVTVAAFSPLLRYAGLRPVVLFGQGTKSVLFSPALRRELAGQGLLIDSMDTAAACRTYNVLLVEDRPLAAALIAV